MVEWWSIFVQNSAEKRKKLDETQMKSKKQKDPTNDLFLQRLDFMCDPRQALVKLAEVLPWDYF